jgi:hypothetical protein
MIDWEWFTDPKTAHFWVYLLLRANWRDGRFKGMEIKRGQLLMSLQDMAKETGLSVQNVRTAINRLKSTRQLTCQSTRYGMLISIVKYDNFQILDDDANTQTNTPSNKELTRNQHATNTQLTTNEEYKEVNKVRREEYKDLKKVDISNEISKKESQKSPRFIPPTLEEVQTYISENNFIIDAQKFIDYYQSNGWIVGKTKMKDWKATVRGWERREQERFQKKQKEDEDPFGFLPF